MVDVTVRRTIRRPVDEVAAFAGDPANAPLWYASIRSVEPETAPPLQVGSRVRFVARFLGRTLRYTYEVRELEPGRRLVMSTAQGPFPMETTYGFAPTPDGGTVVSLRNRGEPSGFSRVVAPLMTTAVRRATTNDLRRLADVLER